MAKTSQTRRPRGSGSVYQLDDGRTWIAVAELPPDPATGARRRLTAKSVQGKAAAVKKLKAKVAQAQLCGQMPAAQVPTLEAWLGHWLEVKTKRLRPASQISYRNATGRIIRSIGQTRLDKITPALLAQWQDQAEEKYAHRTVLNDWQMLKEALTAAAVNGLLAHSPATGVEPPVGVSERRPAPTPAEAAAIIAAETDPTWQLQWTLAFLGMRQSERHGVCLSELEVRDGVPGIAVRHQLAHPAPGHQWPIKDRAMITPVPGQTGWVYAPAKTRAGERWIPLLGTALEAWNTVAGLHPNAAEDALLCLRPNGAPLSQGVERTAWAKACGQAGITRHLVPHSARHTADSILAMLGVPDATRIGIIGHASTAMDEVYVHAQTEAVVAAARQLAGQLEGVKTAI